MRAKLGADGQSHGFAGFRRALRLGHQDYTHDLADRRSPVLAALPGMQPSIREAVFAEGDGPALCLPPLFECGLRLPIPEEPTGVVPTLTTFAETERRQGEAIGIDAGLPVSYP